MSTPKGGFADRARSIVITGASAGIGAALANSLAQPGVQMLLIARNDTRLAAIGEVCRAAGATVTVAAIDVTDRAAMADALTHFDDAASIDLLIANAGISSGLDAGRTPEPPDAARRVFAVHLEGMLNTLDPVLPAMLARGHGQIALMSSLAASAPLADMPAYSASKAAIRAYGTSLRRWLTPRGIAVSVICPGFVETAMSARHRGFKPFLVSRDRAAARILRGLKHDEANIAFPWPLVLLTWLGNRLPPRLSDRAMQPFAAQIEAEQTPPADDAP